MLTILDAQMKAFSRAMEEDFQDRAAAFLLSRHGPGAPAAERVRFRAQTRVFEAAEIARLVEQGLAVARAHGFSTEAQAVAFIELCLLRGPGFHTRGRAAEIVASAAPPADRLRALQELDEDA